MDKEDKATDKEASLLDGFSKAMEKLVTRLNDGVAYAAFALAIVAVVFGQIIMVYSASLLAWVIPVILVITGCVEHRGYDFTRKQEEVILVQAGIMLIGIIGLTYTGRPTEALLLTVLYIVITAFRLIRVKKEKIKMERD